MIMQGFLLCIKERRGKPVYEGFLPSAKEEGRQLMQGFLPAKERGSQEVQGFLSAKEKEGASECRVSVQQEEPG